MPDKGKIFFYYSQTREKRPGYIPICLIIGFFFSLLLGVYLGYTFAVFFQDLVFLILGIPIMVAFGLLVGGVTGVILEQRRSTRSE